MAQLQAEAPKWSADLQRNGLAVFHAGARAGSSEVYALQNGAGVVLGKLFTRSADDRSSAAPLQFNAAESAKIFASRGRHLVERYWGRYVAFLQDGATWVLRDPTAVLPCFHAKIAGVDVYFSWLDDAVRLGFKTNAVNWPFIVGTHCLMRLQINETALSEVSQILGGECVEHRDGRVARTFYWNPLHIAEADFIEDRAEAVAALHRAARDNVQAWGSCYESIVHTLSGGLDSSIVMACLQDMPARPQIACINYYSEGSDTDERNYARLSAQRAGVELIERERNSALSLEPVRTLRVLPLPPTTWLFYIENHHGQAQFAREHGATAIFSGNTGDQLFYQAQASFAVGDYVRHHGVRPALFNVALDAARMDRASVWHLLREGIRQGYSNKPWSVLDEAGRYQSLLLRQAIEQAQHNPNLVHPLFQTPGRCPSGKLYHAFSLVFPPDLHNPMGDPDDAELVAPLYSQPLIEVLLRTPTYLLTAGGWDRATARRAFQHDMPREIAIRRTKGGMEEHAKAIFLRHIDLVRELLLDGLLVREKIIDRAALEEVLSGKPTRVAPGTVELFEYLGVEAWLRRVCAVDGGAIDLYNRAAS